MSFFFCQYDDISSLDAQIILRTLIRQCLSEDNMSNAIEIKLAGLLEGIFSNVNDLEPLLEDIAAMAGTIMFVVDGFDECQKPERTIVLKTLQRLMSSAPSTIKVFLSTREDMKGEVDRVFPNCQQVFMDCEETHADILTYIKDMIDDKKLSGDLEIGTPQLETDIQRALMEGANGM